MTSVTMTEVIEDQQVDAMSVADSNIVDVPDDSSNAAEGDFISRAITHQTNMLSILLAKDIRAAQKTKLKEELQLMMKVFIEQSNRIATLQGQLQQLETSPKTYAVAAAADPPKTKSRSRSRPRIKTTHAIIVKPKNEQSSDATLHDIKKNVKPKEIDVVVEGVRKIAGGGIVITTQTDAEAEKFSEVLKKSGGIIGEYQVQRPRRRNPQMVIYDVAADVDKEELRTLIVEHNEGINQDDISIKTSYRARNGGRNWIVEIQPRVIEQLENKKITIGWQRANYREYIRPTLCFNCGRIGHIGKHCRHKTSCMKCGATDHLKKDCKETYATCINCVEHNKRHRTNYDTRHSSQDKECRCWEKEKANIMAHTNYDEQ